MGLVKFEGRGGKSVGVGNGEKFKRRRIAMKKFPVQVGLEPTTLQLSVECFT